MQNPVQYVNPPQQTSLSGQSQTVLVQVPQQTPIIYKEYRRKQSFGLGVTQICAGILCIIFNAVGIALLHNETAMYIGYGIWSGGFFILSGSFGIPASRVRSKCMILTFMVLSIVSACLALTCVLTISAVGLDFHAFVCDNYRDDYHDDYREDYSDDNRYDYDYGYYEHICKGNALRAVIAMEAILVILAVVETVAAIWSSAICCAAVCCGSRPSQGQMIQLNGSVVQCSQVAGQPEIFLTSPLQGAGYLQQPLQFQQVIPQQSLYPQQQEQPTQSLPVEGAITPPQYEQLQPPKQQTKTSA